MISQRDAQWYAFVTKPRHEKKAKKYLDGAGVNNFLPLRKTLNQWKDRKRWVEAPLIPSYIFCHIPYVMRYDVLTVPSVVRVVGFRNDPTPVQDKEIDAIKLLLNNDVEISVQNGLVPGDHVKITSGILNGYEGEITEIRGSKYFVIHIISIGKSILVDARHMKIEKI